jgi:hypothetical protein
MKVFHCDHCQQLVFFENVQCVNCQHALAYLPDVGDMGSLEPAGPDAWTTPQPRARGRTFRLCKNYSQESICNWAVPAEDPNPLCQSCRLTRIIPSLSVSGHRQAWYRLEVAKRRLIYSLLGLGLPLRDKLEDAEHGLAFEFMADPDRGAAGAPILTGHANGVITLSVAEANDAEREKRRLALHEPYRTLLGHFRHESAHYYWDLLLKDSPRLDAFREFFGDERVDYKQALERHYQEGPPADWQEQFVTAYASAHPWEDWAETWAHYLHITDTLETAISSGLALRPWRADEPALTPNLLMVGCRPVTFDRMISAWFPLTYLLNNLNRGLGLPDGYPFVLSDPAIAKLRFVHDAIEAAATTPQPREAG